MDTFDVNMESFQFEYQLNFDPLIDFWREIQSSSNPQLAAQAESLFSNTFNFE